MITGAYSEVYFQPSHIHHTQSAIDRSSVLKKDCTTAKRLGGFGIGFITYTIIMLYNSTTVIYLSLKNCRNQAAAYKT